MIERSDARDSRVKDHSRYCVDVRYMSSSVTGAMATTTDAEGLNLNDGVGTYLRYLKRSVNI